MNRRNLTLKEKLILVLPAVAAIAAVLVIMLLLNRSTTYEIGAGAAQYYAGGRYVIEEGSKLHMDSDGNIERKMDGESHELTDLPVYYENESKAMLPTDMIYFIPRDDLYGRTDYFSEVSCKGMNIKFIREKKELSAKPGFLYDGDDFYLFLEPVVLEFNGYKIELPALSYVEAIYAGHVMAFNYETKECFMDEPQGAVTVTAGSGDYEISLLNDTMVRYDGVKTLLFTRPDLLDPVEDIL